MIDTMADIWYAYQNLPSREPSDWAPATRGERPWDQLDFHVDLGCGRVPKGRLGIDLRPSPGATDLAIDFDHLCESPLKREHTPEQRAIIRRTIALYEDWRRDWWQRERDMPIWGLPFRDESIRSIVTHHCLEHVGEGFEHLMEECYRILDWGGIMRIIVPLFPSSAAVSEYDHKRYFMEDTFQQFCATPQGDHSTDGFSEPYNKCAFKLIDQECTPPTSPELRWTKEDIREVRLTLWKYCGGEPEFPDPEGYA